MKIFWGQDSLSVNIIYLERLFATIQLFRVEFSVDLSGAVDMPLYAAGEDGYVFAADAEPGASYRCLECRTPLKLRRGRDRVPHFYHLQRSPGCHLYSKSEDHLVLQLQVQRFLADRTVQIERPFLDIHRVADVLWEKEKIAFEIQCSNLDLIEAESRIRDYNRIGYEVVWLLDDRIFNRRFMRDAEELLRSHPCYFFKFQRSGPAFVYDQMEIIISKKRMKRGSPIRVDLSKPRIKPSLEWPADLPSLIEQRIETSSRYFPGDLLHKTILAALHPGLALYLARWRRMETSLRELARPPGMIAELFEQIIAEPYDSLLNWLIERVDQ